MKKQTQTTKNQKTLEQLLRELIADCQEYTRKAQAIMADYKFTRSLTWATGLKRS